MRRPSKSRNVKLTRFRTRTRTGFGGAGVRFDPPRFLKAGDVLRVDVSGVGSLQNPVVAEQDKIT